MAAAMPNMAAPVKSAPAGTPPIFFNTGSAMPATRPATARPCTALRTRRPNSPATHSIRTAIVGRKMHRMRTSRITSTGFEAWATKNCTCLERTSKTGCASAKPNKTNMCRESIRKSFFCCMRPCQKYMPILSVPPQFPVLSLSLDPCMGEIENTGSRRQHFTFRNFKSPIKRLFEILDFIIGIVVFLVAQQCLYHRIFLRYELYDQRGTQARKPVNELCKWNIGADYHMMD